MTILVNRSDLTDVSRWAGTGPPRQHVDMQKMRTLLTSRKLLKRKLIDLENHIRGALRAYGLLVGAVARGAYQARVRELLERSDPILVYDYRGHAGCAPRHPRGIRSGPSCAAAGGPA